MIDYVLYLFLDRWRILAKLVWLVFLWSCLMLPTFTLRKINVNITHDWLAEDDKLFNIFTCPRKKYTIRCLYLKYKVALSILTAYTNFVIIVPVLLRLKSRQIKKSRHTNILFLDPDKIYTWPPSKRAFVTKNCQNRSFGWKVWRRHWEFYRLFKSKIANSFSYSPTNNPQNILCIFWYLILKLPYHQT